MSIQGWLLIGLFALAAIAGGLWLLASIEQGRERRRQQAKRVPTEPAPPQPMARPAPPVSAYETPVEAPEDNARDRFKDRLRERKAAGVKLSDSLNSTLVDFSDRFSVDDGLRIALEIGYLPVDAVACMATRGYQLREMADFLAAAAELSFTEFGELLLPFAGGDTLKDKADAIFEAVKGATDTDDEEEDIAVLPEHLGCSKVEAAAIVYRNTESSFSLGTVVKLLRLGDSPEVVAAVAKEEDVDLSEDGDYAALREDDGMAFIPAAKILKACGADVESILDAENSYETISEDDLGEFFGDLSGIGFTAVEIMVGMSQADIIDEDSYAVIVGCALERKVSMAEIVDFLKREKVDPGDLDEELRSVEMDIAKRVDVLHALLHDETPSADVSETETEKK